MDFKMKKTIPVLISILIFMTGCSERKILKGAEDYLKDHIGNSKSYDRIEWIIADTTYLNEIKSSAILDSIRVEKEALIKREWSNKEKLDEKLSNSYLEVKPIIKRGIPWRSTEEIEAYNIIQIKASAMKDSIDKLKTQNKIDSFKIISDNLLEVKERSPIYRLYIRIRFRARMDAPRILTYKSLIIYNVDTNSYEVSYIEYDGVEKDID
jgi:hypothetical protein